MGVDAGRGGAGGPATGVNAERARELLRNSTDSVSSELERAEGWLKEASRAPEGSFLRIEAEAGAIGALANAWGRLTLRSRSGGADDRAHDDLSRAMDRLVELRGRLDSSSEQPANVTAHARQVLDVLRRLEQELERG